jgi:hypothetical protein
VGQGEGDESLAFGNENGSTGTVDRHWKNWLTRAARPFFRGMVRLYDDEFLNFGFNRPRLIHDGYNPLWVYVSTVKSKRFGDGSPVECELIPV